MFVCYLWQVNDFQMGTPVSSSNKIWLSWHNGNIVQKRKSLSSFKRFGHKVFISVVFYHISLGGHFGRDRMVVWFSTTCAISEFEPRSWWGVLDTTLCDKVCQWLATGLWFSLVSSTNKTDRHDITEILLKVALNTINLYRYIKCLQNNVTLVRSTTTKCMASMNYLKNIFTFKSKIENLKITLLLFVLQDAVRERQDGDIWGHLYFW